MSNALRIKIMILCLILGYILNISAQNIEYGLKFKAYEVEKEKRTSLNLTPIQALALPKNYTFSFDLQVDFSVKYPFGYVFRMISNDGKHIDFLFSEIENTGVIKFMTTYSAKEIISGTVDNAEIKNGLWTTISFNINSSLNMLNAQIGSSTFRVPIEGLESFRHTNIIFGKSEFAGFQNTDIPSFLLKNIQITDRENRKLYHWVLNKHSKEGVYDEINQYFAKAENPTWVIDEHVFWKKQTSFRTNLRPLIAYNNEKNEIAIYDHSHFFRYDLYANKLIKDELNQKNTSIIQSNNLIFNPYLQKYAYYTLEMEKEKDVLLFDTTKIAWSAELEINKPTDIWHHNHIISSIDSCLYLFGGYGHLKYKNDVRIYNFKTQEWRRTHFNGDTISPRYLSCLGQLDNKHILIFGGYGNQTGNQELSPQYFYDLFVINLETLTARKIWTLQTPTKDFVVANSMLVDTTRNSFYTLALAYPFQQFNTTLSLLRFSLDKPEYEILGDSISLSFEDTKSFIDLYLNKKQDKEELISIISTINDINDSLATVSIYKLTSLPLSKKEIYQSKTTENDNYAIIIIFILLFVAVSLVLLYSLSQKKKRSKENMLSQIITTELSKEKGWTTSFTPLKKELRKQSIYLFGGFCVVDKEGNDISKEFTPMLKQLFILILLYTFKERRGISSVKLKELLWFDKTDESAKNNRGVSISKLRVIFEMVGQVKIQNNKSHWIVELGDDIYCDYLQALYLMEKFKNNDEKSPSFEDIHKLLQITSTGELLPNLQEEWIDPFKSDFANELIDLLLDISRLPILKDSPQVYLDIADTIFIHDSLSEEALQLKCSVLVNMGRNGLANKAYNAFIKEYNLLFGTNFHLSFEQLISKEETKE